MAKASQKVVKKVVRKVARPVIRPWTKEDFRTLKAHSIGALRRKAGILGVGLGHLR